MSNNFSVVYHELLEDLVQEEVPTETWADCNDCHHCKNVKSLRFNTKCCDFIPSLPNYVIGSILKDTTNSYQEGKSRILHRIKNKFGVTPFGIFPSSAYQQKLSKSRKNKDELTQQFVNDLKCCYYNNGSCTIYKYKSDLCGFYHCSSVALDYGKKFWKNAIEFNAYIDRTLSIHVAEKLGFQNQNYPKELKKLSSQIEDENGSVNEEAYKQIWGNWYGKEVDYFLECEKLFRSLNKQQFKSILGDSFENMNTELVSSSKKLQEKKVPDYLVYDDQVWNSIYKNENSTQSINPIEHLLLKHFDGKTKTEDIVKKGKLYKAQMTPLLSKSLQEKVLRPV